MTDTGPASELAHAARNPWWRAAALLGLVALALTAALGGLRKAPEKAMTRHTVGERADTGALFITPSRAWISQVKPGHTPDPSSGERYLVLRAASTATPASVATAEVPRAAESRATSRRTRHSPTPARRPHRSPLLLAPSRQSAPRCAADRPPVSGHARRQVWHPLDTGRFPRRTLRLRHGRQQGTRPAFGQQAIVLDDLRPFVSGGDWHRAASTLSEDATAPPRD